MANIRLKTISIDSSPLFISNGQINLNKLTLNGGIGILNTSDSNSFTSGGSFTVLGGVNSSKDSYLYSNLIMNDTSEFNISDTLHFNNNIFSLQNKFTLNKNHLSIGNLNISGGISVLTSSNNSLVNYGGASLAKTLYSNGINSYFNNTIGSVITTINGKIIINNNNLNPFGKLGITQNTIGSKIELYQGTNINVDENCLKFNINSEDDSHVFYSNGLNGNGNELLCITGDGFVGINNSTPSTILDINGEFSFKNKQFKTTSTSLVKQFKYSNIPLSWKSVGTNTYDTIVWSNKLDIFLAITNTGIFISQDGINWLLYSRPTANSGFILDSTKKSKLIWSAELGQFIMFSIYDNSTIKKLFIFSSSDGINWSILGSGINNIVSINCITWSIDLNTFIISCENNLNNPVLFKSTDCNVWEIINFLAPNLKIIHDICWSSELFTYVAIGETTNNVLCTLISDDSVNWVLYEQNTLQLKYGYKIIWNSDYGIFCALATADGGQNINVILTSENGINWTVQYSSLTFINDIYYAIDINLFIATTQNKIITSYNTIKWNEQNLSSQLGIVSWSPTLSVFVILSNSGIIVSNILKPNTRSTVLSNNSFITSLFTNGNIGIGTTSPNYDLHINGDLKADDIYCQNILSQGLNVSNFNINNLNLINLLNKNNTNSINLKTTNLLLDEDVYSSFILTDLIKTTNITATNFNVNSQIISPIIHSQYINILNNATIGNMYVSKQNNSLKIGNTLGNVNINELYVSGSTKVSKAIQTTKNVSVIGGLSVNNDSIVYGGMSVTKSLYVENNSVFHSSLFLKGGLEIKTPHTGLTVAGGLAINKDLYISGTLITGVLHTLSINLTNKLDDSLLCLGGIVINNTKNSSSIINDHGGSLLVRGGSVIQKDLHLFNKILKTDLYISQNDTNIQKINISELFSFWTNNRNLILNDSLGNNLINIKSSSQIEFSNTAANSVMLKGSILISDTLNILGGMSIQKSCYINNNLRITSTIDSSTYHQGALNIKGGLAISKNLSVNGNVTVLGNFNSNSNLTHVDTNNVTVNDNIMLLKPNDGINNSGLVLQRFQKENDAALGDVTSEDQYLTYILGDQLPLGDLTEPTNTILLPQTASNIENYYNGWWIKVNSGFIAGQTRKITSYNPNTKIATLSSYWNINNPSIGDRIDLYNKPFAGIVFNKDSRAFEFINCTYNNYNDLIKTELETLKLENVILDKNLLINNGGLGINNSTNSTSSTSNGTIISYGGASFNKNLYVNNDLVIKNKTLKFNESDVFNSIYYQSTSITGSIPDFSINENNCLDIYMAVRLLTSTNTNYYTFFHIRCINIESEWIIAKTYVGDDFGINFNINTQNILEYSIPNIPNFQSVNFKYKVFNV